MFIFHEILSLRLACALLAGSSAGCLGTELSVASNHAGNPAAHSAALPLIASLRSQPSSDASPAPGSAHEHDAHEHGASGHTGHEHGQAASDPSGAADARYTCPMHPEVVTSEPGKCPKCGMNLVPKKADP